MRTVTNTYNVYSFDELSDDAKEKVIGRLSDINVEDDWWGYIYDDAKNIGVKIEGFDIDRGSYYAYCKMSFLESPEAAAHKIIEEHGKNCETYKTAKNYLQKRDALVAQYSDSKNKTVVTEDNNWDFDQKCDELDSDFLHSLSEDYRIMLEKEYEYQTSEEAIIETIEANNYEFLEDGTLA